jgi:hypothetical protein
MHGRHTRAVERHSENRLIYNQARRIASERWNYDLPMSGAMQYADNLNHLPTWRDIGKNRQLSRHFMDGVIARPSQQLPSAFRRVGSGRMGFAGALSRC